MNNKFDLESYTQYLTQYIHASYRGKLDTDRLSQSIENEFNFVSKRLENLKGAEKFRELCFIEGTEISDYRVRRMDFDGYYLIVSIRFKGLDVTKPFVEIEYHSLEIESFIDQFPTIKPKLIDEFKVFGVKDVNVLMSADYLDLFSKLNPMLDKPIYSALLSEIHSKPKQNYNFSSEKIGELSAEDYKIYLDEYHLFNKEFPELIHVHAEPHDTINRLALSDFVFKIIVDGQWTGLCIYDKLEEFFFFGYHVWDKIVFKQFRGQNLSARAQDLAFQDFITDSNGFIFGYIDPLNLGSIKAAEKTGRKFLAGFYTI